MASAPSERWLKNWVVLNKYVDHIDSSAGPGWPSTLRWRSHTQAWETGGDIVAVTYVRGTETLTAELTLNSDADTPAS